MTDIRIKIADEADLYNPFSPEDELSDDVKTYIISQVESMSLPDRITFTLLSQEKLDMERLSRATKRWNKDIEGIIKREKRFNHIK